MCPRRQTSIFCCWFSISKSKPKTGEDFIGSNCFMVWFGFVVVVCGERTRVGRCVVWLCGSEYIEPMLLHYWLCVGICHWLLLERKGRYERSANKTHGEAMNINSIWFLVLHFRVFCVYFCCGVMNVCCAPGCWINGWGRCFSGCCPAGLFIQILVVLGLLRWMRIFGRHSKSLEFLLFIP